MQVSYDVKGTIKKGPLNMICDIKTTNKRQITLIDAEDYIKNLECIIN